MYLTLVSVASIMYLIISALLSWQRIAVHSAINIVQLSEVLDTLKESPIAGGSENVITTLSFILSTWRNILDIQFHINELNDTCILDGEVDITLPRLSPKHFLNKGLCTFKSTTTRYVRISIKNACDIFTKYYLSGTPWAILHFNKKAFQSDGFCSLAHCKCYTAATRCKHCGGSQVNNFEQVSSLGHQLSLPWGGAGVDVPVQRRGRCACTEEGQVHACMVRSNASWVMVHGKPPPLGGQTDRQTRLKTLHSCNFVGER